MTQNINKMGTLDLFIDKEKIDSTIKDLLEKKENLQNIVENETESALKRVYPLQEEYDLICKNKEKEINKIKESLYKKYHFDLKVKIRQYHFLRKEVQN